MINILMKNNKHFRYTLQRTMIIYFLLVGFASLLVGVEFILDTHSSRFENELLANCEQYNNGNIDSDEFLAPVDKLRSKAVLMIGIILLVMIIVLTMFVKNITEPLQHMIEVSREISKGDLNHSIRIEAENELAQLGGVINEMASNLQEILLLARQMCRSGERFVSNAEILIGDGDIDGSKALELKAEVRKLHSEIAMMQEVIEYFNIYTVEHS